MNASNEVTSIDFKLVHGSGIQVCQTIMGAAYHSPPSTWKSICDAIRHGEQRWRDRAHAAAVRATESKSVKVLQSEIWWSDRIKMYEPSSSRPHVLLYDACEFTEVFKSEFLVEQISVLKRSNIWGTIEDIALARGRGSWYEGRRRALHAAAIAKFGEGSTSYKLAPRSKHRGMPGCKDCEGIKERRRRLLAPPVATAAELAENTQEALDHAKDYMGERKALENMKLSAGRSDTVFWLRDKCGDDCLYTPAHGRVNQSLYQYRMAMMAEIVPDQLLTFSLLPTNLTTGGNFGATSLLSVISDMMDAGIWTQDTKRAIFNSDGGPECVGWVLHAVCEELVTQRVVKEDLIFARLIPEHHHDFADATFGVAEDALTAPGYSGPNTPWELQAKLRQHFSRKDSEYGKYALNVQFQYGNYDFEKYFDGCISADFQRYKSIRCFKYAWNHTEEITEIYYYFKYNLRDVGTFQQDEWGPWDEIYVEYYMSSASKLVLSQ